MLCRLPLSRRAGSAAGRLGPYIVISGGATDQFDLTSHVDVWLPAGDGRRGGHVVASAAHPSGDPMPERWQHSAVSWGGSLYLYGGQDRRRGCPCGVLHVLSLDDAGDVSCQPLDRTRIPTIRSRLVSLTRHAEDLVRSSVPLLHWPHEGPALSGHSARLAQDGASTFMLAFGGKAPGASRGGVVTNLLWQVCLSHAHTHDPRGRGAIEEAAGRGSLGWRLLHAAGTAPAPRHCHSAVNTSRGWLIFGGWAQGGEEGSLQFNQGTVFLNDLHVLDLPCVRWAAMDVAGSVPRGRCQSVMVAAPDEEIVLLFGGACHNDPQPRQSYGDMVMDLDDVALLHLPTATWLPQKGLPTYYEQRGGTNTLICTGDGRCFIFGGMNSDEAHDEPNFLNHLTELVGLEAGVA